MINNNIIFAYFAIAGATFAEIRCVINALKLVLKSKVWDILFQIIYPIIAIGLYTILNVIINFGQFRLYTLIAYLIGFALFSITFYKILDKMHKLIYNKLTMNNGIKYTKLGRFLLK